MSHTAITFQQDQIAEFCTERGIHKLALFGSVLREDFHADSDVDMLVEFEPGTEVDLFDIVEMELELSAMIGLKVDLRTPADLSRYFRQSVVDSAQTLYERT